jgi:hypothetical protein
MSCQNESASGPRIGEQGLELATGKTYSIAVIIYSTWPNGILARDRSGYSDYFPDTATLLFRYGRSFPEKESPFPIL